MTAYETIIRENEDEINHYKELEQRMYEESETPGEKIITELTGYMQTVQEFDKDSAQDAQVLHAYVIPLATHNNSCYEFKYHIQDKAGIGGLLHLHEFASLLLTPGRTSCVFHFKSSDK